MSPDAPPPTFDSAGNVVTEWAVAIRYDALRDHLSLTWHQEAGPYHKAKRASEEYAPQDIEDLLAAVQRVVRILGARRLF